MIARANPSLPTLPQLTPRPRAAPAKPVWLDLPSFTAFAQEVEDAMIGEELNYSDRLKLLKRANHFGIRRFDANMIIAMVQNRTDASKPATMPPRANSRWTVPVMTVVVVQSIIVVLTWALFTRVL